MKSTCTILKDALQPEDLIIQDLKINYAMKAENPVDHIGFFRNWNDRRSLHIPSHKVFVSTHPYVLALQLTAPISSSILLLTPPHQLTHPTTITKILGQSADSRPVRGADNSFVLQTSVQGPCSIDGLQSVCPQATDSLLKSLPF